MGLGEVVDGFDFGAWVWYWEGWKGGREGSDMGKVWEMELGSGNEVVSGRSTAFEGLRTEDERWMGI